MAKIYSKVKGTYQEDGLLALRGILKEDYICIDSKIINDSGDVDSKVIHYALEIVGGQIIGKKAIYSYVHNIPEALAIPMLDGVLITGKEDANKAGLLNNVQTKLKPNSKTIYDLTATDWVSEDDFLSTVLPTL